MDDAHRDIVDDHELTDVVDARDADLIATFPEATDDSVVAEPADIRTTSQPLPPLPAPEDEDWTRVPTPDQTAQAVDRAKHALAELHRRRAHDHQREADDAHADQLARWRDADRDTAPAVADEPVLSGPLD